MIQVWVLFYLLPMMGNHATYETKECCERNLTIGSYCERAYIKNED